MARRRKHKERACAGHNYTGVSTNSQVEYNLLVDEAHKLIFCKIQKVSSTFWKMVLVFLSNKNKYNSPYDIGFSDTVYLPKFETVKQHGFSHAYALFQSSFKFMFVREPYGRLFSGYMDKMYRINIPYWKSVGRTIVSMVRHNASRNSLACGHDVTFPEFVKYMVISKQKGKQTDRHFSPMYEHCRPCQLDYNFIGKLETFKQDSADLIKILNRKFNGSLRTEDLESEAGKNAVNGPVNSLFENKAAITKCITFYEAMKRVWRMLQIRGTLCKNITFPVNQIEADTIHKEDFLVLALDAYNKSGKESYRNRKDSMAEAYGMVPKADLEELLLLFKPDCNLFDYEERPSVVFNNVDKKDFKFFDSLGFMHN
jgi:hypothetical protein